MSHKDQTKLSPIRFFDRRMYRGLGVSMARSCVINGMLYFLTDFLRNVLTYPSHLLYDVRIHEKAHQPVGSGPPQDMNKMHSSIGVNGSPGNGRDQFGPLGIWAEYGGYLSSLVPLAYGMGLG